MDAKTMKRITHDLFRVIGGMEGFSNNAGNWYRACLEVKALATALVVSAENGMDDARREDPAEIERILRARIYNPHR
ncbi:hypothetical protein HY732_00005 [Candidatus Uhrbacteria bacterium]|nr:hypothetical protein [Candidatus Uhrbacteria bacterium]